MTITSQVAVAELTRWGDHWLLRYGDDHVVLADLKGLGYLARPLAEPGLEIHAADLAGAGTTVAPLPVLDGAAEASYRRRLAELEAELADTLDRDDDVRRVHIEQVASWALDGALAAVGTTSSPPDDRGLMDQETHD